MGKGGGSEEKEKKEKYGRKRKKREQEALKQVWTDDEWKTQACGLTLSVSSDNSHSVGTKAVMRTSMRPCQDPSRPIDRFIKQFFKKAPLPVPPLLLLPPPPPLPPPPATPPPGGGRPRFTPAGRPYADVPAEDIFF